MSKFHERGFLDPISVFTRRECQAILHFAETTPPSPSWYKGNAAAYLGFYRLGTTPALLELSEQLLGPDVMLWGARVIRKRPGESHSWHSDMETAAPDAKSATIWIGLENTARESSLRVLSFSHLFGESLQFVLHGAGFKRQEVTDEVVLKWASERDHRSDIETFDVHDGEALVFDGRLWHGSRNEHKKGYRSALLLQYCTPATRIRMHELEGPAWPVRYLPEPRPPCVMVLGRNVGGNCKFPICGNRKPPTLVVGGGCPAFHDVDDVNNEGAGHRCMDGRRGCC